MTLVLKRPEPAILSQPQLDLKKKSSENGVILSKKVYFFRFTSSLEAKPVGIMTAFATAFMWTDLIFEIFSTVCVCAPNFFLQM